MRHWELEELLAHILCKGNSEKADELINKEPDFEELVYDKFGISFDQFSEVVESLIPFTIKTMSPLNNKLYQGFIAKDEPIYILKNVIEEAGE